MLGTLGIGSTASLRTRSRARSGPRQALWLFVLLALSSACAGQSVGVSPEPVKVEAPLLTRAREEIASLARALDQLPHVDADAGQSPSAPAIDAARLARARKDLTWLERRVAQWQPSPAIDAFVTALAEQRELLAEVSGAPPAEATPAIDAVLIDVAIKAQQCRLFGGPVPVEVRVVTRDPANQEVSGYEVWYARKAYEHRPREFRRFEQNSSPARHVFADAGYYVFWTEHLAARAQGRRGEALDVEVGPDQREQVIDLLSPLVAVEPAPASVETTSAPDR